MHRIICTLLICLTASVFCACSGNGGADDTTGAVPAYKELIATLRSCSADSADRTQCDKHKIWESLDSQTKSQFLDAYAALVKIDRIIETYFDPIEHKYMRTKTGTNVLKEAKIDSYEALFAYLFHPETLKFNANTDSGVEIEKTIVQNDNVVTIQTHYNQQVFTMIRESDGVWRTSGLLHSIPSSQAKPL